MPRARAHGAVSLDAAFLLPNIAAVGSCRALGSFSRCVGSRFPAAARERLLYSITLQLLLVPSLARFLAACPVTVRVLIPRFLRDDVTWFPLLPAAITAVA